MKKQNIEDIFSSMENFSSVPPPELWNNIEKELHVPKKKRRAIVSSWYIAAAAFLIGLLIPSAIYFYSDSQSSQSSNHKINGLQNNSVVNEENNHNSGKNNTRSIDYNSWEETIKPDKNTGSNVVLPEEKKELANSDNPFVSNQNTAASIVSNDKKDRNTKTNNDPIPGSKQYQHSNLNDAENLLIKNKKSRTRNQNTVAAALSRHENQKDEKIVSGNSKQNKNSDLYNAENLLVRNKKARTGNQNTVATTLSRHENQTDEKIVSGNSKQNQASARKEITGNENTVATTLLKEESQTDEKIVSRNSKQNQASARKEITGNENTLVTTLLKEESQTDKKNVIGNSKQDQSREDLTFKNKLSKTEETIAFSTKNRDTENDFNEKDTSIITSNKFENYTNAANKNNEKAAKENSATESAVAINSGKNSPSDVLLTVVDSIQLAELQNLEKSLSDSNKTKKDDDTKTVIPERWSLEVFAGVANSENLGKDKTLGNVNQSKQTNTYGVKTNYKLNKKWAVSSGLKINELGQSVANVSYINNRQSLAYPSTNDYFNQSAVLFTQNITNNSRYIFVPNNAKNAIQSNNFRTGNIDQSLKYIEMPLEVSYAIFSKNKTSISLNTGGFVGRLISNNVLLDGTSIGSNPEANDFVYGSLLSSTLQYRLYKKTHIFVEPGMNYYLNPLSNQSFNQFQWAFNFGLNVSF